MLEKIWQFDKWVRDQGDISVVSTGVMYSKGIHKQPIISMFI